MPAVQGVAILARCIIVRQSSPNGRSSGLCSMNTSEFYLVIWCSSILATSSNTLIHQLKINGGGCTT